MALRARCSGVILSDVIPHHLELPTECGEPQLAQSLDDDVADGGGQDVPSAMRIAESEAALIGTSHACPPPECRYAPGLSALGGQSCATRRRACAIHAGPQRSSRESERASGGRNDQHWPSTPANTPASHQPTR